MERKSTDAYKIKFGYICMICFQPGGTVHHITRLASGGEDNEKNWILLCEPCHIQFHKSRLDHTTTLKIYKNYFESRYLSEGRYWEKSPSIPEIILPVHRKSPKIPKYVLNRPKQKIQSTIQTKEESSLQSNLTRATRMFRECDACGKPLAGKQQRFCCDSCRWVWHNAQRLNATNKIKSMAIALRTTLKAAQELLDSVDPQ